MGGEVCADRTAPEARPLGEERVFGELLRRAREQQNMTLETVARRTRIAPRHLEALERSDLDVLPAGPFGRGYVRAYAEALGIDPGPILSAYGVQEQRRGSGTAEDERRLLEELSHLAGRGAHEPQRPPWSPAWLVAAAVVLAVAGSAGWLLVSRRPQHAPLASPPGPPATSSPAAADPRRGSEPATPTPTPAADWNRSPELPAADAGTEPPARPPMAPVVSPPTESLRVAGFGVGADVVDRRLVGRSDRFPEGSRVVFWTEVLGGRPGHVVRHVWFQGGRAAMRANLPVRGGHWRTHSSLVLPRGSAGAWTVEARTSDGRLLVRNDFVCEPAPRRSR
jgi:cytoskeletal protein RodZ